MRHAHALFLLVPLAGLVACKRRASADECTRMLDRYVDMTAAADPSLAALPDAEARELWEARRASKRREPNYERAQAECERDVSGAEYECAMAANTANDWEACIE